MAEQSKTRTIILAVILAAVIAGGITYMRISQAPPSSAEKPKTEPIAKETVADQKLPEPTKKSVADSITPSDTPPLTLKALQYMPEMAQVAIGIPPVSSLIKNVAPLVQELVADEMDVAAELEAIARDLAKDMEVEESSDLAQVVSAMGIDAEQGPAVFLTLSQVMEEMLETLSEEKNLTALPDMSATKAVIAIPITDAEKAKKSLDNLTKDMLSGIVTAEEKVGETSIVVYPDMGGYFMTDAILAIGNDLAMLKEAAAHASAPAQFRYGSMACPADNVHEAVVLIQGAQFLPILENASTLIASLEPSLQALISTQVQKLKNIYSQESAQDPMIVTMNVTEDAVELKSKIDTSIYPGLLESMGEAQPLRWAPRLPKNTLAFLSLCFSPEAKKQIMDEYLPAIPEELRNQPGVSQGMMYSKSVMDMLGREVTLGFTDLEPMDFPSLFLIIELSNPVAAQMLLQMAPQLPHGDPYREVQIKKVNFPSPIQLYFALVDDAVVLSNNDTGLQQLIDLSKDGGSSGFFASLNPPLEESLPTYQAMLVKPNIYADIISPLAALSGRDLPKEVEDISSTLHHLFNDVRFVSEMRDSWLVTRIFVSRKK